MVEICGNEWVLTKYLQWGIHASTEVANFNHFIQQLSHKHWIHWVLSTEFLKHLSNDHKDHPNWQKNNLKLQDEKQNPRLSLKENQWTERQQPEQYWLVDGYAEQISGSEELNKSKVSKNKYNSRWVDWENLIYIKWSSTKNPAQR